MCFKIDVFSFLIFIKACNVDSAMTKCGSGSYFRCFCRIKFIKYGVDMLKSRHLKDKLL